MIFGKVSFSFCAHLITFTYTPSHPSLNMLLVSHRLNLLQHYGQLFMVAICLLRLENPHLIHLLNPQSHRNHRLSLLKCQLTQVFPHQCLPSLPRCLLNHLVSLQCHQLARVCPLISPQAILLQVVFPAWR